MSDRKYKATALAAAVATALGSAPQAMAQDDSIEEVIVTGSYIRRTEFEGRAPIQIVDSAEIALTGATQPIELLNQLTVNSGSQFYNETNDRAGVSQFNIRNLGLGSTLTLLNGKRAGVAPVADAGGTDFVDINQFPLAMIERIEVLTDGASATYGSQAVAGVANIITRKGFEGFEISGGGQFAEIDAYNLNLAAGSQFDKGGFNVYATYYEQGHIERSEFDWMQDRLVGQGDISRSRFLSSTGSPGTYRRAVIDPVTGEAAQVPDAQNNPDATCEAAGGVFLNPADIGGADDFCRYHFVDQVSVISAEERFQMFTEFDWEFSDQVKYYAEASFSNNLIERDSGGATLNTGRANGGGLTIPGDHPFNFYENDPNDPTALIYVGPQNWDPNVNVGATLRGIARPLGAEVNNNELTQQIHREFQYQRILNGFEVNLNDSWYIDFSYMWAKAILTTDSPHNYRSDVFQDLILAGDWNPFGTRLSDPGLVSPKDATRVAGNDPLVQQQFDQRSVDTDRAEEKVVDLVAAGELFETSFGTIAGAIGGQYRRTEIDSVPDSLSAAGEANEQGLTAAIKGSQDVVAFFAEAVIPINDFAEVQLAVRNEDYGDGVSTTDPKVSFELMPTDSLAFRGSWGTSFQAPTVRQTAASSSSAFLDDPASPGPNGSVLCNDAGLNNNVTTTVRGAPGLQPQESENFNIGVIFQTDQFRASIDFWNFDYEDLIAPEAAAQGIVNAQCPQNNGDPIIADPRVVRDAGGQLREVISQFQNINAVKTNGIDVAADYALPLGNGDLNLNFAATWVNSFEVDEGNGIFEERAGNRNFLNGFSTIPELRANANATYFFGNNTINVQVRHIGDYENDQSNNAKVDAWNTIDAQYSYVWSGLLGDGDTTFTLGVNNIADEDPPALRRLDDDGNVIQRFDPVDGTYNRGWIDRPGYDDRAGHDLRGRVVYFSFRQTF